MFQLRDVATLVVSIIFSLNMSLLSNCRTQFLLDRRLGRCLKLFVSTESTSCQEFVSQFGLALFIREKHPKPQGNRVDSTSVFLMNKRLAEPAKRGVTLSLLGATDTSNSDHLNGDGGVCVCACVHACDVFAIYDNNSLPRLIMIVNN